jgi:glyoxylase-like metal-dependent hydrolase (beta-lactamase superfamily II)
MSDQLIPRSSIQTIDLNFQGIPGTIAVYLIPHSLGAVLVECGPSSTLTNLQAGLKSFGLEPGDITDVLVTHIHLDHAGSAGWWARQGARIHVHPVGAPHLSNPEKLLSSASRIYGEKMQDLWGEFLPVPEERLVVHEDDETLEIDGLRFRALDTPGHAYHHFAYIFQDICFSGDIGGVRVGGVQHVRLPAPPPELHFEHWKQSLQRLKDEFSAGSFTHIAPTHFGLFNDPAWHLNYCLQSLEEMEYWMAQAMARTPDLDSLNDQFLQWVNVRSQESGLSPDDIKAFEAANPSWMTAQGIFRYWHKVRSRS